MEVVLRPLQSPTLQVSRVITVPEDLADITSWSVLVSLGMAPT